MSHATPPQDAPPRVDRKEKKRRRADATESFVIVKPPPGASSTHPLNLQVQFVAPTTTTTSQASGSSNSARSSASLSSASTTSVNSTTSSSGGTGLRRSIIPLYNLQHHTMLAHAIHDAGTDDKVSRFLKHGLELLDVGMLEPVEVWGAGCPIDFEEETPGSAALAAATPAAAAVAGMTGAHATKSAGAAMAAVTSGLLDLPNVLADTQRHDESAGTKEGGTSNGNGGMRKFFGRLFHSKSQQTLQPPPPKTKSPVRTTPPPQSQTHSPSASSPHTSPSASSPAQLNNAHPEHALPPVLGTIPLLQSLTVPPQGRPAAYVWVTRKWSKPGRPQDHHHHPHHHHHHGSGSVGESWFQQLHDHHNNHNRCEVDLRFEWTRASPQDAQRRGSGFRRPSSIAPTPVVPSSPLSRTVSLPQPPPDSPDRQSPTDSRPGSEHGGSGSGNGNGNGLRLEIPDARRPSVDARRRGSTYGAPPAAGAAAADADEYASDPEDSEVPWTCTLVIRPRHPPNASSSSPTSSRRPPALRLKVASLAPAPHHPKVVAQLKCAYPLPDVDLLTAQVVPRDELPGVPNSAPTERHMLTAEDIKDIVCSTSIWVVVREGFGGLAKKGAGAGKTTSSRRRS